jgi:RNA polymerase sigma-70 factor, ECF subfamily
LSPSWRYESLGSIELEYISALQTLPPRKRAALILCDVVGLAAEETAQALDTSVAATTSALQRARATLLPPPLSAIHPARRGLHARI